MEINQIYQRCLGREITPETAVELMDESIGGITASRYDPKRMTIGNHTRIYSLDTRNQNKKTVAIRERLALLAYMKAKENGSRLPGELHFSRGASTKDHMQGIERMVN